MIQAAACLSTLFWCSGAGPTWRTRASSRAPPREPPTRPTRASRRRRSRLGRSRWASSSAPSWRRQLAAAARAPSSSLAAGCSCALSSASWAPSSSGAGSRNSRPACRGALKRSMERAPKKVRGPAGAAPGAAAAACGGRGSGNGGAERRVGRCTAAALLSVPFDSSGRGRRQQHFLPPSLLPSSHAPGGPRRTTRPAGAAPCRRALCAAGRSPAAAPRAPRPRRPAGWRGPSSAGARRGGARPAARQPGRPGAACVHGARSGGNTKGWWEHEAEGWIRGRLVPGPECTMQTPAGGMAHRRKSPASRAAARGVAAPSAATPSLRRSSRQ